ncbi:hypothetical protein OJ253_89 [Cryptosporidium canis]|uniref:Uncharacterized protein n=1 Tax=Cryptosporidium canis TaxID=195482 RepID=A0A9D5DJM6_9CRYT|nr:hypothetical protein OJ253_89 [Cryptosporidium canis]
MLDEAKFLYMHFNPFTSMPVYRFKSALSRQGSSDQLSGNRRGDEDRDATLPWIPMVLAQAGWLASEACVIYFRGIDQWIWAGT